MEQTSTIYSVDTRFIYAGFKLSFSMQYKIPCFNLLLYAIVGLPDGRYFTANWADAGTRLVFWKSVSEAGILKIDSLL